MICDIFDTAWINSRKHVCSLLPTVKYRKIPKISPGAFIFQRPFLRGLYSEGLIFREAYIRRGLSTEGNLRFKIDWASLIVGSKFIVFTLFFALPD